MRTASQLYRHARAMRHRRHARRAAAISFLGGCCKQCGTTRRLEFDHIDPTTKLDSIGHLMSASVEVFWQEVRKCQLLCHADHEAKTATEAALAAAPVLVAILTNQEEYQNA